MTNDHRTRVANVNSIYGHLIGFVVGIAAAAIAAAVASHGVGGNIGQMTSQMAGFGGFIIGYAVGFMVGTLPIFPVETPDKPISKPAGPPQIVGQACAVCEQRILFVMDGTCCPKCTTVYHTACLANCPKCDADAKS
jgi:hypothetical protein